MQISMKLIRQIYEALKKYDEGAMTTADDANLSMIAESLIELGEKYSSDWLKERGKRYLEGHKLFPRKGKPETALDWCYVKMDYEEFMSSDEYTLSIPAKNALVNKNWTQILIFLQQGLIFCAISWIF